jgi:hypothetical protein
MLNLFSTFNYAGLAQTNYQVGQNLAYGSPYVTQNLVQSAGNSAVIYQLG